MTPNFDLTLPVSCLQECDGVTNACPADAVEKRPNIECRAVKGACDEPEVSCRPACPAPC